MRRKAASCLANEKGSALIVAVLILIVLTVAGILASRTANVELQIASHDKVAKMTGYSTEAACEGLAPELIEQVIESGGSEGPEIPVGPADNLIISNRDFHLDETCKIPTDQESDFQVSGLADTTVHVVVFGTTSLTEGNAIQLPEGYHGRGKGLAAGGAQIRFVIRGLGRGAANSEARVSTGWRHVI